MRVFDAVEPEDEPRKGQLSLVTTGAPEPVAAAGRGPGGAGSVTSLADRLRAERATSVPVSAGSDGRTAVLRRGGEATLDELLVGAWEGLSAHRPVVCPACRGATMLPRPIAAGGACEGCGAQLR